MKKLPRIRTLVPLVVISISTLGLWAAYQYSIELSSRSSIETLRASISARLNFLQVTTEQFIQIKASEYTQQSMSSLAAEPDLVVALATDIDGKVIASTRFSQVGKPWQQFLSPNLRQVLDPVISNRRPEIWQQGDHLIGISPVCPNDNELNQCGFVYYEASLASYRKPIVALMSGYTLFTLVTLMIVGIVTSLLVRFTLTSPINFVTRQLRRFAKGERNIKLQAPRTHEMYQLDESIDFLLQSIIANEEILTESEEKMRTIVNTVAGAIITVNHQGVIENFNPGAEALFGYDSIEVVGQNVNILMPEPDKGQHDQYMQNYLQGGEKRVIGKGRETKGLKKDGTVFPLMLTVSETRIRDQIFFTGILIDLTEQNRITNALSAANRELFTTNLALKESVRTDAMTGLYNRAFFNTCIEGELNRSTRYKYPVSIVMCDIDYFKRYNDHYGHQQGDFCIAEVALLIKDTFSRSGEIPARYGGEEFIVIVPNMPVADVVDRAEYLRRSLLSKGLLHHASDISDYVTLSIGVSNYDPYLSTQPPKATDLINAADTALYHSKSAGRNRVSYVDFDKHGNAEKMQ